MSLDRMAVLKWMSVLTLCGVMTAGCGNTGDQSPPAEVPDKAASEPAELVFHSNNGDSVETFDSLFGNALRKQFPQYTIKYIRSEKGQTLPELLAQNQRIDIVFASMPNFFELSMGSNLQFDMTELAQKNAVDLGKFEPTLIDGVKLSSDGKLYGLPVTNMVQAMFYNKLIFDKFGVPYPKDGMTWEETAETAKKLNRSDGGKQYLGFAASPAHILRANSLSQPYLDPATDKPTFERDEWKKLIDAMFVAPAADQGYKDRVKALKRIPYRTEFTDTQELALFVFNSQFPFTVPKEIEKVSWDVVALPTFKEKPRVGSQATPYLMGITSMAKNKDAAMNAIHYLTSKEVQESYSKDGIMPVLNDAGIKKAYGQNSAFKDKNWQAIFYNSFAPMTKISPYHLTVENIFKSVPVDVVQGTADMNSALRTAAEKAEKAIAEVKRK
ncbi:ABC transporter substrate-binding protein [Paenibacillus ginsengarvi]|uniref:Extracellular solute-binding protein n=1 Tax=Paenibacillus ginsengarvi TaxID=400777 RepID=A0A3B0CT21_9BACL|nr:extracellular solute-binding protein [Paenibacillus ginsengarvi]RKN86644.1 extracellular solute-binding protein [Paenibacillus ginsengarvi]